MTDRECRRLRQHPDARSTSSRVATTRDLRDGRRRPGAVSDSGLVRRRVACPRLGRQLRRHDSPRCPARSGGPPLRRTRRRRARSLAAPRTGGARVRDARQDLRRHDAMLHRSATDESVPADDGARQLPPSRSAAAICSTAGAAAFRLRGHSKPCRLVCHAHGFAWACVVSSPPASARAVGSTHAHAKPWAWHTAL